MTTTFSKTTLARTLVFTALLLAAGLATEVLGIVVAPTAVYLSSARPAGVVILYNPSAAPEEVSVETLFGYPATDGEGRLQLVTEEDSDDPRSAAGWIRALPRRLVVPPGERRAVRLLAQPPTDLPEGEYWSRLVFTAREQEVPESGAGAAGGISVGLNVQVRTVIAANFRKGQVATGVAVEEFAPRIQNDSLVMQPRFVRQGNAAFIGRLQLQLVDEAGEQVMDWEEQVAVYRDYHRRYAWDVSDLPPGRYRFQLRLSTDREDVAPQDRLPAVPVVATAEVVRP